MQVPKVSNDQKVMLHLISIFYLRNAKMSFWIPLASCDTNTSANVAPHLDYPKLTNALAPLMRPLASPDAAAGASGIT